MTILGEPMMNTNISRGEVSLHPNLNVAVSAKRYRAWFMDA
jgi:hypothetical protein